MTLSAVGRTAGPLPSCQLIIAFCRCVVRALWTECPPISSCCLPRILSQSRISSGAITSFANALALRRVLFVNGQQRLMICFHDHMSGIHVCVETPSANTILRSSFSICPISALSLSVLLKHIQSSVSQQHCTQSVTGRITLDASCLLRRVVTKNWRSCQ